MKKIVVGVVLGLIFISSNAQNKPWLNSDLDIEVRISSLIDAMTLEEKISQTINESAEIKRLGVDEYNWWSEALHGVGRSGRATVFPQAIGLAAAFDPVMLENIGVAISDEARAINNHLLENGRKQTLYQGLSFWCSVLELRCDGK